MTLTLRDANRKEVAAKSVTTDEYGMASADFVLPQNGLNGVYTLRSDYGNVQYYNFTVEEYKRPTFGVEIEKAASVFLLALRFYRRSHGDSLQRRSADR